MPNHKSAAKRSRQSETRRLRNRQYLSSVKSAIKQVRVAIEEGVQQEKLGSLLQKAQSALGKAASKGLVHRNNASRKTARLTHAVKSYLTNASSDTASADPVTKKKVAKKSTSKAKSKTKAKSKAKVTSKAKTTKKVSKKK